jgi:hypothetical protein
MKYEQTVFRMKHLYIYMFYIAFSSHSINFWVAEIVINKVYFI